MILTFLCGNMEEKEKQIKSRRKNSSEVSNNPINKHLKLTALSVCIYMIFKSKTLQGGVISFLYLRRNAD
jgi:hypothetical protein